MTWPPWARTSAAARCHCPPTGDPSTTPRVHPWRSRSSRAMSRPTRTSSRTRPRPLPGWRPCWGWTRPNCRRSSPATDRFVYITKGLTPEQWRQIKDLGIVGIFSEKTTKRTYPAGTLAANVLGFVNSEGVGSGGLEMALDSRLKGVDGSRTFEQGAAGQAIPSAEDVLRAPSRARGPADDQPGHPVRGPAGHRHPRPRVQLRERHRHRPRGQDRPGPGDGHRADLRPEQLPGRQQGRHGQPRPCRRSTSRARPARC